MNYSIPDTPINYSHSYNVPPLNEENKYVAKCGRYSDEHRVEHGTISAAGMATIARRRYRNDSAWRAQNLTKINLRYETSGNPEVRGSSSSKISILSRPFVDRGIEPAAIMSRPLADSIDKLNIERQPRGVDDACIDALGIHVHVHASVRISHSRRLPLVL